MPRWWKEDIEQKRKIIFQMIPEEPESIQSKDLFNKARETGISPNTVWKYVKIGLKNKSLRCIVNRPKDKRYQRTERSDLELKLIEAINDYRMILNVIVPILTVEQMRLLLKGIKRNIKNSADLLLQITDKSPKEIRDTLKERGTLA